MFLYALLLASVSGWWVGSEPATTLSEGWELLLSLKVPTRPFLYVSIFTPTCQRLVIPEGPCAAGYTGGRLCLEETERPLLAQEGPTQAR